MLDAKAGTVKPELARAIHQLGNPQAPFVEVNCTAIAPSLFESELFGYVGGAFTGAKSEGKVGFFEAADRGTIFLDEIGEMAPEIQVKLLHVLQNKTIYRVGSSKPVKIDVRVIAATNKNVEEEVAQGRFRRDLYYRLNVFPIHVPPIREHKADLYLLINQLLLQICRDYGLEPKQFSGRGDPADAFLRLAGERPRTGKRHRAGHQHLRFGYRLRGASVHRQRTDTSHDEGDPRAGGKEGDGNDADEVQR